MSIIQLTTGADYPSTSSSDANSSNLRLALPLNANYGIRDQSAKIRGSGNSYDIGTQNGTFDSTTSKYYSTSFVGNAPDGSTRRLYSTGGFSAFGTNDFCIECYAYITDFSDSQLALFYHHNETNSGFQFLIAGDTFGIPTRALYWNGGSGVDATYGPSNSIPLNQWVHLAVTRSSGTIRLFVNGVNGVVYGGSSSTNFTYSGALNILVSGNSKWNNSRIQDYRVYQGVAKYTSNFTPPGAMFI